MKKKRKRGSGHASGGKDHQVTHEQSSASVRAKRSRHSQAMADPGRTAAATTKKPKKKKGSDGHSQVQEAPTERGTRTTSSAPQTKVIKPPLWARRVRGLFNRLTVANFDAILTDGVQLYEQFPGAELTSVLHDTVLRPVCDPSFAVALMLPLYGAFLTGIYIATDGRLGDRIVKDTACALREGMEGLAVIEEYNDEDTSDDEETLRRRVSAWSASLASTAPLARFFLPVMERATPSEVGQALALVCTNLVTLLGYCYTFDLLHCTLAYDLIKLLVARLHATDINLLLTFLRISGEHLRADDPSALKDVIVIIEKRVKQQELDDAMHDQFLQKRVSFMLEAIYDLKNNKGWSKRAMQYGLSGVEVAPMVKDLQDRLTGVRKQVGHRATALQVTLGWSDASQPSTSTSTVGSGSGSITQTQTHQGANGKAAVSDTTVDPEQIDLAGLAQRQRMNTDVRRAIFSAMLSAEDYVDAFDRITSLNLKGKQDREIVHVLVDCCGQERMYNPFYALLGQRLCSFDHNFKFTFQYSWWDQFKEMDHFPVLRISNLAHLLAQLLGNFSLSLAVLKVVTFDSLSPKRTVFFRSVFKELFDAFDAEVQTKVFHRIADNPKLSALRAALTVFLKQHLNTSHKAQAKAARTAMKPKTSATPH